MHGFVKKAQMTRASPGLLVICLPSVARGKWAELNESDGSVLGCLYALVVISDPPTSEHPAQLGPTTHRRWWLVALAATVALAAAGVGTYLALSPKGKPNPPFPHGLLFTNSSQVALVQWTKAGSQS